MDSPVSNASRATAQSSVIGSLRGCTMAGIRIPKENLRRKITMPQYLRLAIRDAIESKDVASAANRHSAADYNGGDVAQQPAESPIVVFVNSRSGGRHGPELKGRLQDLMGEEQVFDLHFLKPHEFVQYGLGCLEKLAELGDSCAKETREKLRIVVAGGDGTVGWVLGCLGELHKQGREPVPPTAIIPLGTGNDLSRSFGWGGSFPFNWRSAIKKTLDIATEAPTCRLDSWNVSISMPVEEVVDPPHSLKPVEESSIHRGLERMEFPDKVSIYEGVFYNYFSIGMDAQVAYGFHHLRNEKPYLAQGPISNKLIYSGYSCKQGWFFTPCMSDPSLSVRSLVALNLNNYASGRNPWGNLKSEYLEKRGFVEAHVDDGLIEIFGLKQGWHASFVMTELISAKHIAQAAAIRFEFRGGEWKEAFMQMDGEPWKQPMNKDYSTFIEIKRVPFQSFMIHGD
ncbi:diacylglycerol kinase 7-like isoform X2 [Actinidia eriantha]|uniref:diacylglycerol kinase 7-like isoform X2 n=1 Tax=Actinidia eriantha TaxID=165200 RepID=UPI002590FF22|nr:diacylglycerol kinase 7-like isoform X2 [Actinidia eriantha]